MVNEQNIKYLKQLSKSIHRYTHKQFLVEGWRLIKTLLEHRLENIANIYCSKSNFDNYQHMFPKSLKKRITIQSSLFFQRVSQQVTPSQIMALVNFWDTYQDIPPIKDKWYVAFENIQDPGNFGTLIRTCDWFGLRDVFVLGNCVDKYNSKVLQTSVGAFCRMNIYKETFANIRKLFKPNECVVADIKGENYIHYDSWKQGKKNILLLGNEANGLSKEVLDYANHRIHIQGKTPTTDSLNVAIAGSILIANIFQRE